MFNRSYPFIRWSAPAFGVLMLSGCMAPALAPSLISALTAPAAGTENRPAQQPAPAKSSADLANLSPAQREMRERNEKLRTTVWEGVAIGAAAGAVIGALASDGSAQGALIGGLVGSGLGYLAASAVADAQNEAGQKLDTIEALTTAMKTKNAETQKAITGIQVVIDENKKKIASLNKQLKAKKIDRAKYNQELDIVRADQKDIRETTDSLKKQIIAFESNYQEIRNKNPANDNPEAAKALADLKNSNQRINQIAEVAEEMAPLAGS
jgi:hypothetical protein